MNIIIGCANTECSNTIKIDTDYPIGDSLVSEGWIYNFQTKRIYCSDKCRDRMIRVKNNEQFWS